MTDQFRVGATVTCPCGLQGVAEEYDQTFRPEGAEWTAFVAHDDDHEYVLHQVAGGPMEPYVAANHNLDVIRSRYEARMLRSEADAAEYAARVAAHYESLRYESSRAATLIAASSSDQAALARLLMDVVTLHKPAVYSTHGASCEGCEGNNYLDDTIYWPCETFNLITNRLLGDQVDMSDITEFILARVAEDETDARATGDEGSEKDWLMAMQMGGNPDVWGSAEGHVTRWSPFRVLAECAAKRVVVEWVRERMVPGERISRNPVLSALAHLYRDHPDFDPDWAAETAKNAPLSP